MELVAEVVVELNHPRLDHTFHYLVRSGEKSEVGVRVRVPLGAQLVDGWIVGYSKPPGNFKLREIASVEDSVPELTGEQLSLAGWMAERYLHPFSEMVRLMVPPRRPRRLVRDTVPERPIGVNRPHRMVLTEEQGAALDLIEAAIKEHRQQGFLLHGVTGSGKTEIYLRGAFTASSLGRQVLYLVPEIALTPQATAWFRSVLGSEVAVWHSKLARGERYRIWQGVRDGSIRILIGARSAVFAPFRQLGLIIVDEEHDPSYKEHSSPYYHAVEVAEQRSLSQQAVLIMGSATPSLERYTDARAGKYTLLELKKRPSGRRLPRVTLVDLKPELPRGNESVLSTYLLKGIGERLERKEQVILFLNRRGYSPLVICPHCGTVLKCDQCSISLVYHRATHDLRCHYCNARRELPGVCPGCGRKGSLTLLGCGIERVEQEIRRLFPHARLLRLDFDSTRRRGAYQEILGSFAKRETDILLGTQMVTKGHDFPGVTLVGVLNADIFLHLPDYRAAERTFQVLTQVAGRAGRGDLPGEVVIQSYLPDHYSIVAACHHNFTSFYREEAELRRRRGYPPFGDLIRLRVTGADEMEVRETATRLAKKLREGLAVDPVAVLGPAPAPILRLKGGYRWQVMLKGECPRVHSKINELLVLFRKNTSDIISVEVDPYGF